MGRRPGSGLEDELGVYKVGESRVDEWESQVEECMRSGSLEWRNRREDDGTASGAGRRGGGAVDTHRKGALWLAVPQHVVRRTHRHQPAHRAAQQWLKRRHNSVDFKRDWNTAYTAPSGLQTRKYCVLCLAHAFMELQDSPGPSAGPIGANGLENHVGISLANRFSSSNSAPQDSSSFGSHVDDDTSSSESRGSISEERVRSALHLCLMKRAITLQTRRQRQRGRGGPCSQQR
eukprot:359433-Chlamydomonas_euryale.AAC.2